MSFISTPAGRPREKEKVCPQEDEGIELNEVDTVWARKRVQCIPIRKIEPINIPNVDFSSDTFLPELVIN